jgi:MtN3 and saliva related transmembrane protein
MVEVIGIAAGFFTTIAAVPQIVRALRTKQTDDLSVGMLLSLCLGVGLWTVYGIFKTDWPIIITNGISLCLNSILLYIRLKNKNNNNKNSKSE